MEQVIKNMNTLKMFQRKGFVIFHEHTGTKISGLYTNKTHTCYYIDDAKIFDYKGYHYYPKFFSGCFNPYLVRIKKD